MMGSGKTSVGRALAARTGWPYHDNDDLLRELSGRSAKEILAADGEPGLRRAEAQALARGLECPAPCIVSAAAGTVLESGARAALEAGAIVVWLRAPTAVLARRASRSADRPWLTGDAEEWIEAADERRRPLYAEIADLIVDTADLTPAQVADEITAAVA